MDTLAAILDQYLTKLGIVAPIQRYKAFQYWIEVVGSQIGEQTEPKRLSGDVLFVEVRSDVWRNELFYHKQDIVYRLNQRLGEHTIKDIVFI
ncbi:DUF721 domain-containing protein [candidate division KSB1 bacterium]|nr:DUF721 domain-containing protein [candidate division KSB1 bacterium]